MAAGFAVILQVKKSEVLRYFLESGAGALSILIEDQEAKDPASQKKFIKEMYFEFVENRPE